MKDGWMIRATDDILVKATVPLAFGNMFPALAVPPTHASISCVEAQYSRHQTYVPTLWLNLSDGNDIWMYLCTGAKEDIGHKSGIDFRLPKLQTSDHTEAEFRLNALSALGQASQMLQNFREVPLSGQSGATIETSQLSVAMRSTAGPLLCTRCTPSDTLLGVTEGSLGAKRYMYFGFRTETWPSQPSERTVSHRFSERAEMVHVDYCETVFCIHRTVLCLLRYQLNTVSTA
ncbi:uncharacterized protein CLUP02_17888 [Colletotrichum lupini]|uniref:Uncharacterized protein n=1 Tax=Colletotrichum lupini TaxID=145971 RepID=A0A9Q8SG62_9PEZI|nr:uncharacterized protein CLUP02_17888 [Colletotrichum lupini]UQC76375.1 hypothetical protein CLUP02_17888 [Colletotrichum lupini]